MDPKTKIITRIGNESVVTNLSLNYPRRFRRIITINFHLIVQFLMSNTTNYLQSHELLKLSLTGMIWEIQNKYLNRK